jgi:GST-like protein
MAEVRRSDEWGMSGEEEGSGALRCEPPHWEATVIDLYFWPTPNGLKIPIFLEEAGVPYRICPVRLADGEQRAEGFRALSPAGKIPAIVDHAPRDGGGPFALFESAAILQYLAEKYGQFLPNETRARAEVLAWLAWQISFVGPTIGNRAALARAGVDADVVKRFTDRAQEQVAVIDARLRDREYVCGEVSIADFALFPWLEGIHYMDSSIPEQRPSLARWIATMGARPAVARALEVGNAVRRPTA